MSRIDEIEKAVKAIALYVRSETETLEKRIEQPHDVPKALSEKLAKLEKVDKEFEALWEELDELKRHKGAAQEMEKIREEMLSDTRELEAYVKSEVGRVEGVINSRQDLSRLRAMTEEMENKTGFLETKLREAEQLAQKISSVDVGKKIADFDSNFNKKLSDIDSRINQKLSDFDKSFEARVKKIEAADVAVLSKRIEKLQETIELGDIHDITRRIEFLESETKKLEETRKLLEDESVYRVSLEKKLGDVEKKIDYVEKSKSARLEEEVTPIIARRLDEFARALDRKVPELMTREEFERFSGDVEQKLRRIEAPDTAPIERRIESLEKKLDRLTTVLKDFLNRMPVVVE